MKKNQFAVKPDPSRVAIPAPEAPPAQPVSAVLEIPKVTHADPKDAEAYINGGMDGRKTRVNPGRKIPISLTIEAHILDELDKVAKRHGISRASAFSLAVSRYTDAEKRNQE